MKIIASDNFDRDYHPDKLIVENVTIERGKELVELFNKCIGSTVYYRLVEDDYELSTRTL
jgi:hypothetical protein